MRIRLLSRFLPALVLAALPMVASAGVFIGVSVDVPPPPLPVYVQPPCPQPGYIWIPGYWAWGPYGYYWVPGTWVLPPEVGLLWTPGYWGWDGAMYAWHAGYWGPTVGFYGGIDYGYGYDGDGFDGGYWRGGMFFYNRAVTRLGAGFADDDYYRRPHHHHFRHRDFGHISFNGGPGGVYAHPSHRDLIAAHERRFGLTHEQRRHVFLARGDRALRLRFNHGRPPIAATDRPSRFHGRGVFAARAAGGAIDRHLRRPMRTDRPAWAASRRDAAPRNMRGHRWSGPAPRFAAHNHSPVHLRGAHRPTSHAWAGHYRRQPEYGRRPAYRSAPRFHARRPTQHFQARSAPRFQARHPAQHFQARPTRRFQARRPMQHFQARPTRRFQAPNPRREGGPRSRPHGPGHRP